MKFYRSEEKKMIRVTRNRVIRIKKKGERLFHQMN